MCAPVVPEQYVEAAPGLEYHEDFLKPTFLAEGLDAMMPPHSIIPQSLPPDKEYLSTSPIWCQHCGRIACRKDWFKWECPNCKATKLYTKLLIPFATLLSTPSIRPDPTWKDHKGLLHMNTSAGIIAHPDKVTHSEWAGCERVVYSMPGGGEVEHIICGINGNVRKLSDGLFVAFQDGRVPLQRREMRNHVLKGFLTKNFSYNAGAAYRYAVDQAGNALNMSPQPIQDAHRALQTLFADVELNEVLSIGYMAGQKMNFHDDGENEVCGPIVGWSLGSDCVMRFRGKAGKGGRKGRRRMGSEDEDGMEIDDEDDGAGKKGRGKVQARVVLKLLLRHGDVVIMHDKILQRNFEHAVTPEGLRFGVTARVIREGVAKKPRRTRREVERGASSISSSCCSRSSSASLKSWSDVEEGMFVDSPGEGVRDIGVQTDREVEWCHPCCRFKDVGK
ncbi:hypothetical protein HDV00_006629 [Rhizophlyctis rosea]|nr:hypothetical protein HDV00_006629 [Rhizophlyctis rosea]